MNVVFFLFFPTGQCSIDAMHIYIYIYIYVYFISVREWYIAEWEMRRVSGKLAGICTYTPTGT